jgi:dihydrolipoamide dehydrogenase
MRVTLVDEEINPGGVCLYRGCIPSKALLHAAKVITESEHAAAWGIEYARPTIKLDKLRAWKDRVVKKLTGGLGQLSSQRKIRYLQGRAGFLDAHTLEVQGEKGREKLAFDYAILATGSLPATLPHIPMTSERVLDSTSALELKEIPKSLLVVGGGYIGLELGTVYAALGSRVSVVEMMPSLLPGADSDLVAVLAKRMDTICESVMEGEKAGTALFDAVLVSVGRTPNSNVPGLGNTRVEIGERGFVRVDAQRRTAEPSIFAIGDVAGEPMLAHKASHEGRVAVEAIAGHKVAFEPQAIPAVVFTDPEIAWCGLTETDAKKEGRSVQVARFPWVASGRATTLDRSDGVTKLVLDPKTERVLGVAIAGPGAGELIAEGVLAVEMAATAADIKLSIHPHPTLSETVMEAAEVFFGQSTHLYRPKKR